jgi:hypothetical protein
MDSNSEESVSGEKSDISITQSGNSELREADRKGWLKTLIVLGLVICISPLLSSFLAMGFALIAGCDSVVFFEHRVPKCSTGASSQIYVLGWIGQYGWVLSIPVGVVVILVGLIGYAATDKR